MLRLDETFFVLQQPGIQQRLNIVMNGFHCGLINAANLALMVKAEAAD